MSSSLCFCKSYLVMDKNFKNSFIEGMTNKLLLASDEMEDQFPQTLAFGCDTDSLLSQ